LPAKGVLTRVKVALVHYWLVGMRGGEKVLEARACGARVVASDLPELREAGGADAIYISPTKEGIRAGILSTIAQPRPTPNGFGEFTWRRSAELLANVLAS
jgi:hypothetical protein